MWKTNISLVLLLLFYLTLIRDSECTRFKVIREWKYINFTWPDENVLQNAYSKGSYIPENNIIAGIKYYDDHYYITIPRMKNGVPATLARIPAMTPTKDTAPLFEPYPSWEMNSIEDCNALQNVQNIEIDNMGQVWIIDGGRIETLNPMPLVRCPPKLIIFDIKKNNTVTSYTFPENVASRNGSYLYNLVVDNTDGGYAYITDNGGGDPGIVVFSLKENRSWKIRHAPTMAADPTATQLMVNGIRISAPINIAGIALGPKVHDHHQNQLTTISEDRQVFYAPLSSLHLYSINSSTLRNEQSANNGAQFTGEIKDYGIKASQSAAMIMDNAGILYYGLLATSSIARWDIHTSFQSNQKIIAHDDRFLQWPASFTFDQNGNLTVVINRLNNFIYNKLNLGENNFRLITGHVEGKSYLNDENFNYNASDNDHMSTLSSKEATFNTDQDPFLVPKPNPRPDNNNESTMQKDQKNTTQAHSVNVMNTTTAAPYTTTEPSGCGNLVSNIFSLILVSSAIFFLC